MIIIMTGQPIGIRDQSSGIQALQKEMRRHTDQAERQDQHDPCRQ
jgi:hypothetical protein